MDELLMSVVKRDTILKIIIIFDDFISKSDDFLIIKKVVMMHINYAIEIIIDGTPTFILLLEWNVKM